MGDRGFLFVPRFAHSTDTTEPFCGGHCGRRAPGRGGRGLFGVPLSPVRRTGYSYCMRSKIAPATLLQWAPFHSANVAHVLITNRLTYHHNPPVSRRNACNVAVVRPQTENSRKQAPGLWED